MAEETEPPKPPPNLLGKALIAFFMLAPLVALGWLIYDPYDWFLGLRLHKAGGLGLVVMAPVALAMLYFAAFLIYGVVTAMLERLGVPLTRAMEKGEE